MVLCIVPDTDYHSIYKYLLLYLYSYNDKTGLVEPSTASVTHDVNKPINRTLINLVLYLLGPMKEDTLETILVIIQILNSIAVLLVRYFVIN